MLSWKHINGLAPDAKATPRKIHVIAFILHPHQLADHLSLAQLVAAAQGHHHLVVTFRFADAVNGRDRGHHNHIASLQNTLGAAQPQLLNVLIDGAVFFNEEVTLGHIGLRLVIVVITDEILHSVARKKLTKLAVKLRSQCFVGGKHNGRPSQTRDHIGHGESFARTRHAQKGLKNFTIIHPLDQLINCLRLIACGQIGLKKLKRRACKLNKLTFNVTHLRWRRINGKGCGHVSVKIGNNNVAYNSLRDLQPHHPI